MLESLKKWLASNTVFWLSLIGGWWLAVWWHHRCAKEAEGMQDSRFGIFLIACINVLRFYAFTLLTWLVFTSVWYSCKLVILSHTTIGADPSAWQNAFDTAIAFAFNPIIYYIAVLSFALCAIVAAFGAAFFFKASLIREAMDAVGFLDTLMVVNFALTSILIVLMDRIG